MKTKSSRILTKLLVPLIILNLILLFFLSIVIEGNRNYVEEPYLMDAAIISAYELDKEPMMVKEAYPYNGELAESGLLGTFDIAEKTYNPEDLLTDQSDPNKFFAENEDWIFGPASGENGFLTATSKKSNKVIPLADFTAANIIIFDNALYFTDTNYELYSEYKEYALPSDRKVGGGFYRISNIDLLDQLTTNPQYHRFGNDTYRVFQVDTDGNDIYALTMYQNDQGRYVGEYFRMDADAHSVGTIRPMGEGDTFVSAAATDTHLYLEVCHMDGSAYNTNQILCIDKNGRIEDARCWNGTGLTTCDGSVIFQSTEDMFLYVMDESGTKAKVISQYPVASYVTQNGYIDAIAANDLAVNFRISNHLTDSPFEDTSLLFVGDWGNMIDVSPAVTGTFDRAEFTKEEVYAASIAPRAAQNAPYRLRRNPASANASADGTTPDAATSEEVANNSSGNGSYADAATDQGSDNQGDLATTADQSQPDAAYNSTSVDSSIPVNNIIPAMDEYFYYITHGGVFAKEPQYSAKGTQDFDNRYFYGQTMREFMMDVYVDASDFKKYKGDQAGAVEHIREYSADYILEDVYSKLEATYQVHLLAEDNSVAIVRVHQTTYAHMHTASSSEIDQLSRDFKNSGQYNAGDWATDEAMYKAKAGVYILKQLLKVEPCDYTYDVLLIYNDVAGIWELSIDVDNCSVEQVFMPEASATFKGNIEGFREVPPQSETPAQEGQEKPNETLVEETQENANASKKDTGSQNAQAPAKKQVMVYNEDAAKNNPYYNGFWKVLKTMTPDEYFRQLDRDGKSFKDMYSYLNKGDRMEIQRQLEAYIEQLENNIKNSSPDADFLDDEKDLLESLKWAKYKLDCLDFKFPAVARAFAFEAVPSLFRNVASVPEMVGDWFSGNLSLSKSYGEDKEKLAKEKHMTQRASDFLRSSVVELIYFGHIRNYGESITGDHNDHDYKKFYYKTVEI